MSNRTFTMIKPDAFANGHSGAILDLILKAGFRVVALKMTSLSEKKAGELLDLMYFLAKLIVNENVTK